MAWSMDNLSLKGVAPQKESNSLPEGRHVCRVANAVLKEARGGVQQIGFDLIEINNMGKTFDRITVHHPQAGSNEKAAKSVQFGKERLVALLTFGGYSGDPTAFRDIKRLNGLIVGVTCVRDDDWTDENGTTRRGGVKPKQFGAYWEPTGVVAATDRSESLDDAWAGASGGSDDLDDEIPF